MAPGYAEKTWKTLQYEYIPGYLIWRKEKRFAILLCIVSSMISVEPIVMSLLIQAKDKEVLRVPTNRQLTA
jgi:hypothetical protein